MRDNPFGTRFLSGEHLIWTGVPAQGFLLTGSDAMLIPFSLIWCGFISSFFFEIPASAPLSFRFFLIPFVCVGLFMLIGRFILDAWIRRRIDYAVTNRRILIQRAAPFASFTSLDLARLPEMKLMGEARAQGTIRFGSATSLYGKQFSMMLPSLETAPQFLAIQDASTVFGIILDASAALGASPVEGTR